MYIWHDTAVIAILTDKLMSAADMQRCTAKIVCMQVLMLLYVLATQQNSELDYKLWRK